MLHSSMLSLLHDLYNTRAIYRVFKKMSLQCKKAIEPNHVILTWSRDLTSISYSYWFRRNNDNQAV